MSNRVALGFILTNVRALNKRSFSMLYAFNSCEPYMPPFCMIPYFPRGPYCSDAGLGAPLGGGW